jgi:membrane fusion protein (multidrug efflux system)
MKLYKYYLPLSIVALAISSCSPTQEAPKFQMAAVPVTVAKVMESSAIYYDEYPGLVVPLNQIELRAQVSGYVTKINFKEGQKVNKGQLLYSIDAQLYQANYEQALANLKVQEANLLKAKQDAERYKQLDKNEAIAKQMLDHAEANLEATKRQVEAAKANVANLHSMVKFTNIYAPFSGTIGISQVKVGTTVVAGQTVLNTISNNGPITVDFAIDQKDIFRFEQLQDNNKALADSIFTLAFGENIYNKPGHLSIIDRAVDPQTGTIKVRLEFENKDDMLKPGMNTVVRVKNNGTKKYMLIPYKAVTESLGEFRVYVVGDNSTVSQRQVELGRQIGDKVIVKSGLKLGEPIVVEGIQNLHEGSTVKVN